jgi:hypothetical protein
MQKIPEKEIASETFEEKDSEKLGLSSESQSQIERVRRTQRATSTLKYKMLESQSISA